MWAQKQQVMSKESNRAERNGDKESCDDAGKRHLIHDTMPPPTLEQDKSIVPELLDFFGLTQQPFGVTPDPSFLYLSQTHREALASLVYGIEAGRGFFALIAKPGMGKTTLLFHLLERFRNSARSAFLFQTQCTPREFLQLLFSDLGFETDGSQDFARMHEEFNHHLAREARTGKRVIVLVDEAQNLDASVLETVRLLSNFETPRAKLLQIVLSGQPELGNKLASRDMVQLQQRVSLLNRLEPFSAAETEQYIQHRLRVSGYKRGSLLTSDALTIAAEFSKGIPRNINNFCFNALSLAFALQQKNIDAKIAREVISDLDISLHPSEPSLAVEKEPSNDLNVPLQPAETSQVAARELTRDLDVSLHPLEPSLAVEKELSNHVNVSLQSPEIGQVAARQLTPDLDVSLQSSEPSHTADKESSNKLNVVPQPPETSQVTARELTRDLDASLHPSEPSHTAEKESSNNLKVLLHPSETNQVLTSELKADLDVALDPPEPRPTVEKEISDSSLQLHPSKQNPEAAKGVFASWKPEAGQMSSSDMFLQPRPPTNGDGRSIPLAEATEYMNKFIKSLKSARS